MYLIKKNLKSRFKNVVGFYFVSNSTNEGIDVLKNKIIDITLKEKYISEKIPVSYLR